MCQVNSSRGAPFSSFSAAAAQSFGNFVVKVRKILRLIATLPVNNINLPGTPTPELGQCHHAELQVQFQVRFQYEKGSFVRSLIIFRVMRFEIIIVLDHKFYQLIL